MSFWHLIVVTAILCLIVRVILELVARLVFYRRNSETGAKKSNFLPAPPIVDHPSPNFGDRKAVVPSIIVLHYTAMNSTEAALKRLSDKDSGVSSHYLVGEDGAIYRLVLEDKRAWHAGVSYWKGDQDINSSSIGIEIANQGDRPFTKAQMAAVTNLCQWIISRHNITARNVLGHSDVAPERKQDPGWFFDWKSLAANRVGLWVTPTDADYAATANWTDGELRAALNKYGYSPSADLKTVLEAFQRHFQPEVQKSPEKIGVADKETGARLAALLRSV